MKKMLLNAEKLLNAFLTGTKTNKFKSNSRSVLHNDGETRKGSILLGFNY